VQRKLFHTSILWSETLRLFRYCTFASLYDAIHWLYMCVRKPRCWDGALIWRKLLVEQGEPLNLF